MSFAVPIGASHFHYTLPKRLKPYRLAAMTVYGIPLFPADWIVTNIAPRGDVYAAGNAARKAEEPLLIISGDGHEELDYVRFFDLLPRLFRLARLCVALAPFGLLCLIFLTKFFISRARALNRPEVFVLILLAFTMLSLPNPIWASCPGLDSSWQWFLNHFASIRAFGSEVVFTYGPLGFALHPELTLHNALVGLGLSLSFALSWVWLLWIIYQHVPNGRPGAWLLLLTMLFPQMNLEWRLVVLSGLLTALPSLLPPGTKGNGARTLLALAFAGMFLALNALIKFTSLVAVLGTQTFCLACLFVQKRGHVLREITAFSLSFVILLVALGLVFFPSVDAVALWIKGSMATASGYNLQMVAGKSWFELALPFAIIAACLLACFIKGAGVRLLTIYAVASPFVFCTMKYAIVRQSSMPLMYGTAAILAMATPLLPATRRFAAGMTFALYVTSLAMVAPFILSGMYSGFPFGLNPAGITRTLYLAKEVGRIRMETAGNIGERDIPDKWRRLIGGGTVLFIPTEMGPAMSAGTKFKVVPLPSLQLYSGCHPYLDERNGALLEDEGAPEWIVCELDVNGSGHFINHPRFWTALLRNYEFVSENGLYALMKRQGEQKNPAHLCKESEVIENVNVGEWLDCQPFDGMEISILWPQSPLGKFCGTFLRSTMCHASVKYDDGATCRFQFNSANAGKSRFRLNWIAADNNDMLELLKGGPIHKPVAIMFEADTQAQFASRVVIKGVK